MFQESIYIYLPQIFSIYRYSSVLKFRIWTLHRELTSCHFTSVLTSSSAGDLALPLPSGHLARVDRGPDAPDVVPVDAEVGEDVRFVVEVTQQSGTPQ